jgi:peptidoglycan/xylan/chitin deacetylase (PgdA/CDA1 family)
VLTYHRVGGGSRDERDLDIADFSAQLRVLADHDVVSIDEGLGRLRAGDVRPAVVLTFDDGFADVHRNAWPLLREHGLPFTIYLATAYMGREMTWEGSTATAGGPGLTWDQVSELAASRLCTVGNHTHSHARPEALTAIELDLCSDVLQQRIGVVPRHFAYPWGIAVPAMEFALRSRFRSAVTGDVGRNAPGMHPLRLRRVPVRNSDPLEFFRAKLTGDLVPERAYGALVSTAKRVGVHA